MLQLDFRNPLLEQAPDPVSDPSVIQANVIKRPIGKRQLAKLDRRESAAEAMASLERDGMELFGVTRGQFSLMDMIEAILDKTGPAALGISTWTAANADVVKMGELLESGKITACRWLVDLTFTRRCPELMGLIRRNFGADAVRVTKTHAKFCTLQNDEWRVAVRSSMNLNQNPRLESFQVGHDPELCDFIDQMLDDVWNRQKRSIADLRTSDQIRWWNDQG